MALIGGLNDRNGSFHSAVSKEILLHIFTVPAHFVNSAPELANNSIHHKSNRTCSNGEGPTIHP